MIPNQMSAMPQARGVDNIMHHVTKLGRAN